MAGIYQDKHECLFGPVLAPVLPQDYKDISKEEKIRAKKHFQKNNEFFKRGKNRIMEKTKEIRQSFSKAVISGSRSGHYDSLIKICPE